LISIADFIALSPDQNAFIAFPAGDALGVGHGAIMARGAPAWASPDTTIAWGCGGRALKPVIPALAGTAL